jgi:hypothetical protein
MTKGKFQKAIRLKLFFFKSSKIISLDKKNIQEDRNTTKQFKN